MWQRAFNEPLFVHGLFGIKSPGPRLLTEFRGCGGAKVGEECIAIRLIQNLIMRLVIGFSRDQRDTIGAKPVCCSCGFYEERVVRVRSAGSDGACAVMMRAFIRHGFGGGT